MVNNLKEKLYSLASDQPSDWKAKAKCRRENREQLKKPAAIAVRVLDDPGSVGPDQQNQSPK